MDYIEVLRRVKVVRHYRCKSTILVMSDIHLINSSPGLTMKHISFAVAYIIIFGLSSSNFLDCHLQGIEIQFFFYKKLKAFN